MEQHRLRELAIQERRARAVAEKAAAAGRGGLKPEREVDESLGTGGGSISAVGASGGFVGAGVAGGAAAAALYAAASGHTSAAPGTAAPSNEPVADPTHAHAPKQRQAQDGLQLIAAATVATQQACQPTAVHSVLSSLGVALMPDLLADPHLNGSSAAGLISPRCAGLHALCVLLR